MLAAFTVLVLADSDVLEFNDSNFESSVTEHDIILVEFFAPWYKEDTFTGCSNINTLFYYHLGAATVKDWPQNTKRQQQS